MSIHKFFITISALTMLLACSSEKKAPADITPTTSIKDCICPMLWLPVCGNNQKTYSNSCSAKCAGVEFTQGPCQIKD